MFNTQFWQSSFETAIKAAAAAALAVLGATQFTSAVAVDWLNIGGVSLLAAIVSLLTSIVVPSPDIRAARAAEKAEAAKREAAAAKRAAAKATKK
jgi:hypothetical protein